MVGLAYDPGAVNHTTGAAGTQIARFSVVATSNPLPGWSCTYKWGAVQKPPGPPRAPGTLSGAPPMGFLAYYQNDTNPKTTGEAYSPGLYDACCTFHLVDPQLVDHPQTLYAECAVIGGATSFQVYSSQAPTYTNDKNDPTKPFFLEFFGYPHWLYPSTPPNGFQQT